MMELLTGNLLVASSLVTDPIHAGGVCLVVHHDETDAIGVMLNRPMKPSPDALQAMLGRPSGSSSTGNRLGSRGRSGEEQVEIGSSSSDPLSQYSAWRMLHFGGPLSGPVVAIHQMSQLAEAETGSGIYVAAQKQHLEDLIRGQGSPYRLIVGHLGWKTEELEAEIESGLWHVVPATADTVFSAASEMWPRLIRRATSSSMAKWIGVPDVIAAAELN